MRALYTACLLLGAALPAGGRPDERPALVSYGGWFRFPVLVRSDAIQKELGLTASQAAKLKEATDLAEKDLSAIRRDRSLSPFDSSDAQGKRVRERDEAYAAILKPEQVRRLNQLALQVVSYRAFRDRGFQKVMGMTEEQIKKAEDIVQKAYGDYPKPGSGLTREESIAKGQDVNTRALEQALAVLNEEQKRKWQELTGKPFEFKSEPPKKSGQGPGQKPMQQP